MPFLAPSFYQLDFSEIPALIGSFAMGPVAGILIELVKILVHLVTKGTMTAMCGALMMLTGKWIRPGVYTVEEFDPDPFLEALDKYGLPRSENHNPELVD